MSEPRTTEVARSWLERCSRDHSTCSPPESLSTAIAPSRIIRVDANANSRIQLIQTVDLAYTIQYVALSYCWGGDQLGKTLKSNINRRKMPFSLFGQAKSIRDAVQVVRELGFSYLWVDSLCIIQDDQKDLATELSRMSDIYEQATLTISAAKSGTSTEGFLNPRSHITISNACGYRCPDGQIGIIQLQSPKKKCLPRTNTPEMLDFTRTCPIKPNTDLRRRWLEMALSLSGLAGWSMGGKRFQNGVRGEKCPGSLNMDDVIWPQQGRFN